MAGTHHPALDLTGRRFGRLVAIEQIARVRDNGRHCYWLCRCDCGEEKKCRASGLIQGMNLSCGCWRRESSRKRALAYKAAGHNRFGIFLRVVQRKPVSATLNRLDQLNAEMDRRLAEINADTSKHYLRKRRVAT